MGKPKKNDQTHLNVEHLKCMMSAFHNYGDINKQNEFLTDIAKMLTDNLGEQYSINKDDKYEQITQPPSRKYGKIEREPTKEERERHQAESCYQEAQRVEQIIADGEEA